MQRQGDKARRQLEKLEQCKEVKFNNITRGLQGRLGRHFQDNNYKLANIPRNAEYNIGLEVNDG